MGFDDKETVSSAVSQVLLAFPLEIINELRSEPSVLRPFVASVPSKLHNRRSALIRIGQYEKALLNDRAILNWIRADDPARIQLIDRIEKSKGCDLRAPESIQAAKIHDVDHQARRARGRLASERGALSLQERTRKAKYDGDTGQYSQGRDVNTT
jgi:hypothetical protein